MKIFITGATGLIGSHLINEFYTNTKDVELLCLKRSKNSQSRVELVKQPTWINKPLDEVIESDLVDIDIVIHLSAHSMNPPYDTLENCLYWNVIAPLRMFELAKKMGVDRFVVAGSCFEYGKSGEEYDFIPVNAPLKPTNTYAASKAAASTIFYQFALENKVTLIYTRIFHVYGEGEYKERLWPSLMLAAKSGSDFEMTKGEQKRDFIYVRDVANKLMNFCFDIKIHRKEPIFINIGSNQPQTVLQFSQKWWKKWKAKGKLLVGSKEYRENEIMSYVPKID